MCGIAGAIGRDTQGVEKTIKVLQHRGPDGQGVHTSADRLSTLAHTRLSVLDLSEAAHQPMVTVDGQVTLVFNGEIYNFRELRIELEKQGVAFHSSGDTEVLLQGYLHWGKKVVQKLRGMFAFALWDGRTRTALLARDRLGMKPLFWMFQNGTLRFASELNGILVQLPSKPAIRPQAISEYLTWLNVPQPGTFFEGIEMLAPGHLVTWTPHSPKPIPERYWEAPRETHPRDFHEAAAKLRELLEETVRLHMVSDVPIGAFLSGGLDSSTLVGLMAKNSSEPIRTFCMTFSKEANAYDERVYARQVAKHFGTIHEELPVESKIADLLPRALRHFGQPFGNPTALLVYELSKLMKRHVKVAISGDGGDELFLGYPRYKGIQWHERLNRLPFTLRRLMVRSGNFVNESVRGAHQFRRLREFLKASTMPAAMAYSSWVSYLDRAALSEILSPEYRQAIPEQVWGPLVSKIERGPQTDVVAAVARADLESFLPDNLLTYSDRMSMAHGLELRVPLCDHVLAEFCSSLPSNVRMKGGTPKALLKEATKDLLPKEILSRPKLGFNPPMGLWITKELQSLVDERLSESALKKWGMIDHQAMKRIREEHLTGTRDHSLKLWAVVALQEWLECR